MNPLQIATITTSLAPIAARSFSKLADIFSLDKNIQPQSVTSSPANASKENDSAVDSPSPFGQLYQQLSSKLQSLLGKLPQFRGSDSSIQVTVEGNGKLSLEADDPSLDLQSIQDWLNQDPQLTELAADTVHAKQDADWRSGISSLAGASDKLHFRIETSNT